MKQCYFPVGYLYLFVFINLHFVNILTMAENARWFSMIAKSQIMKINYKISCTAYLIKNWKMLGACCMFLNAQYMWLAEVLFVSSSIYCESKH